MKFKIDTNEATPKQAMGLVAALVCIYGENILDALDTPKPASLAETLKDHASPEALAAIVADGPATAAVPPGTPAPDGYPTEEAEPNAAEAFGATPPQDIPPANTDSAGLPWDERIHSSSKGTNKDGTWSRRRNTPDATFDAVMAELRVGAKSTIEVVEDAAKEAAVAASNPAGPPPPPPPPAPAADAAPITFASLMMKVTRAQGAQKITKDKVHELLGSLGLTTMPDLLKASPDTLAAMNAMVDDHVGA